MTKSSRRKDRSMGYPKETAKYKKCEEHKNKIVKIGGNKCVCSVCGLVQKIKKKVWR
ncbi:MAG: hypothetical protein V3V33_16000 [Candidatus Lokiarchaeia archaeon]